MEDEIKRRYTVSTYAGLPHCYRCGGAGWVIVITWSSYSTTSDMPEDAKRHFRECLTCRGTGIHPIGTT